LRVARFATVGVASPVVPSASPAPAPTVDPAGDFDALFAVDFVAADPAEEAFAAVDAAFDLDALACDAEVEDPAEDSVEDPVEDPVEESTEEEPDSPSDASATAVAVAAAPPAFANHSRIVSARPIDTGERWVAISGISSAWQRATMSLELTPSSLAS
jgi:hypothetical protein